MHQFLGGIVASGGGGASALDLVSGAQTTSELDWVTVGARSVTGSDMVAATFKVLMEATAGRRYYVRLYNLTDAVAVTGALHDGLEAVPTLWSFAMTAGVTVGYELATKTYLVQIHMDAGDPPEAVSCKGATLEPT